MQSCLDGSLMQDTEATSKCGSTSNTGIEVATYNLYHDGIGDGILMSSIKATPSVRRYVAGDQAACEAVFLSNVPRFFGAHELEEFRNFLTAPDAHYLVVFDERGVIVGCGGAYVAGTTGCLCWGMVHQDLHGRSLGSLLLVERLEWLFAQPAVLEISIHTSQRSAGFFEHFGFVTSKVTSAGFGPELDEVSMTLARERWRPRETSSR